MYGNNFKFHEVERLCIYFQTEELQREDRVHMSYRAQFAADDVISSGVLP